MDNFPKMEIVSWIYKEYKELNPDYIMPIGNRIFSMLFLYRKNHNEFYEMFNKITHINAINYIDSKEKCIMLIDEETKYGRKFIYDVFPHLANTDTKSIYCYTVFLSNDNECKKRREDEIKKLEILYKNKKGFSKALKKIRAYKIYDNDEQFHQAIYNFRKFIKLNINMPYNIDATKFYLIFKDVIPENIENYLCKMGTIVSYDKNTLSLFPNFFSVENYSELNGIKILNEGLPKLRIFRHSNKSLLISPMVYLPIEFPNVKSSVKLKSYPLLNKMLSLWKDNIKIKYNDKNYLLQFYDIIILWFDIELFKNFIQNPKFKRYQYKITTDKEFYQIQYGEKLGTKLLQAINNDILDLSQYKIDFNLIKKQEYNENNLQTDIATLLSIKAACLEEYSKQKNGNIISRKGLSFSRIKNKLNIDDLTTSVCIDILCDNACLKPFDKMETRLKVNRFYNTDIEEFIGIFIKLIRRAEEEGIPMGRLNLNKFTTFLDYFVLSLTDRFKGHTKVICAREGKVLHIIDKNKNIDERLENLLTEFPRYKDVFDCANRKSYKIKKGAFKSEHDFMKHTTIIEGENVLDAYINEIIKMYEIISTFLEAHPEIVDSKGKKRTIYDAFPGLIELFGKDFPEGGLKIVGTLLFDAMTKFKKYITTKRKSLKGDIDKLISHSIPHKIRMYQQFSNAYLECYKYLSLPYESIKGAIWKKMCVYPPISLILELCEKLRRYIEKNMNFETSNINEIEKNVNRYIELMINISSSEKIELPFFDGTGESNGYIVSVDLRNSTELGKIYDKRWIYIEKYLINIMSCWAKVFNGKLINKVGDEIIVMFSDLNLARSFAAGSCQNLNEICDSINKCNTFKNIETGCRGKIIFGLIDIGKDGNCYSSEINELNKELAKDVVGKIIIDLKSIALEECLKGKQVVNEERPYIIIDPAEEFKELIISKFESKREKHY